MNEFPMWNIGIVNGIETTYEVHWLEWDTAMVTVDGDEIVTFASSKGEGFTDVGDVTEQAVNVVYDIEDEEWD